MRLSDLMEMTAGEMRAAGWAEGIEVTGLTADSRRVVPGDLFAALPGRRADGRAYIAEAIEKGAVAVLAPTGTRLGDMARPADRPVTRPVTRPITRPVILVEDDEPRRRLSLMAARFHAAQPDCIAAVTGTNGKTSVADFTRQIWERLGRRAASLGTLGLIPAHPSAPASLTTPDPIELHRCLAALAGDGVRCLAMEASSHGLDQYRLDGVRIAAAAFTNLSRDHLDYHGEMGAYLAAKRRLFSELVAPGGAAVLNADDETYADLRKAGAARGLKIVSYGRAGRQLRLREARPGPGGLDLSFDLHGRPRRIALPLAGAFQAHNALAALGLALATGAEAEAAVAALGRLAGVPGRMERVAGPPSGAEVYVDYAHTPDALATVLRALRPHTRSRLWVVFGCGGDRDRGKRPQMGAIAGALADRAIVTDDNPRGEDPAAIRKEILAAVSGALEIGDRGAAIAAALAELGEGDLLVVAGKGHEPGQIVGDKVLPFDDREAVRRAAADLAADLSGDGS